VELLEYVLGDRDIGYCALHAHCYHCFGRTLVVEEIVDVHCVVAAPGVFVPQRRVRTIVLMDEMLVCEDNVV